MTASLSMLVFLVSAALILTMVSPLVLILFLVIDWKRGEQW
ncbi:MAG: hypothetical protein OEZ68_07355 [Gammaproteobacteria bacterium]|nr:hypothetical protein [Gammaproteobacteria bacterium]MDH5800601.1 hypothetical protein [Gammaproteobacteria bacterium]